MPDQAPLALTNAQLIDGTGTEPVDNATVNVAGGITSRVARKTLP